MVSTPKSALYTGTPSGCERVAYTVIHTEDAAFSDTYGGGGNVIGLDCHLVRRSESLSRQLIVMMHPTGGGMYLPIVGELARQGHHVLWANSRYRGTDSALIMEKVVADLGVAIADAKQRFGYERIVLGGWSGGGALSLHYQALAAAGEGITDTPAGDRYEVGPESLPPIDALVIMAAHISRHGTLTEWMDPSITDERAPFDRLVELNLYNPANPNQRPYESDYVERFRAAQRDRNRRITAWVKDELATIRQSAEPNREQAFVVHGTMADPRWLDATIDPSDRQPNHCYLGEPRLVNDGPVGLARFSTLRSWLSQWSFDDARADAVTAGASIDVPTLVIGNTADDACTPSHTRRIFDALAVEEKSIHQVVGATHYYTGPDGKAHRTEAVATISDFLDRTG